MKTVKLFLIPLSICLITLSSCKKTDISCIPNKLQKGIIAFYPFSNGSINDFSGNGNDLSNTTTASSAMDRNGNTNCAFEFNNSDTLTEFLSTSTTSFLDNLSEYSISLWYQPLDTIRPGGDFEVLLSRDSGFSCPDRFGQWSVALYDCRQAVFGRQNSVWETIDISTSSCQQTVTYLTGNWKHLVATYNQSDNEMKIYLNGALQDTQPILADCGSGVPTIQDIGDLFIGVDYTGRIDDIIIYNKTLNQSEIDELFGLETCCE